MRLRIWILLIVFILTGCTSRDYEVIMEKEKDSAEATETAETTEQPVSVKTEKKGLSRPELLTPLIRPHDEDFVRVKDYIPEILTEQRYSTTDNFTGQVIYDFEDSFLRYGTVMKLKEVSEELKQKGLFLKIWDGFRPVSAQFKLWEVYPDDTYVANPNHGFSNHSRGFAVDVTLVDSDGIELEMPTGFDDFSRMADRDYSDCSETAAQNAKLLETVMEAHGFKGYAGEWWHFNDTRKYDVETCFDPGLISCRFAQDETALLEAFGDPSSTILMIPAGEPVTLLGFREEYSLVEYWGYRGYLLTEKLRDNG